MWPVSSLKICKANKSRALCTLSVNAAVKCVRLLRYFGRPVFRSRYTNDCIFFGGCLFNAMTCQVPADRREDALGVQSAVRCALQLHRCVEVLVSRSDCITPVTETSESAWTLCRKEDVPESGPPLSYSAFFVFVVSIRADCADSMVSIYPEYRRGGSVLTRTGRWNVMHSSAR